MNLTCGHMNITCNHMNIWCGHMNSIVFTTLVFQARRPGFKLEGLGSSLGRTSNQAFKIIEEKGLPLRWHL